jgi:hypothetical protein
MHLEAYKSPILPLCKRKTHIEHFISLNVLWELTVLKIIQNEKNHFIHIIN